MTSEDENDKLVIHLYLRSKRFESTIEVPLIGTKEQQRDFVESWLQMMEMALKLGSKNVS